MHTTLASALFIPIVRKKVLFSTLLCCLSLRAGDENIHKLFSKEFFFLASPPTLPKQNLLPRLYIDTFTIVSAQLLTVLMI